MTVEEMMQQSNAIIEEILKNEEMIIKEERESIEEYEKISHSTQADKTKGTTTSSRSDTFDPTKELSSGKKMDKVSAKDLADYFTKNGGKRINDTTYEIKIDGNSYRYDIKTESLYVIENGQWKNYVGCSFYTTSGTKLGEIKNTITLLPGSGETTYGAVKKDNNKNYQHTIPSDTNVYDNSLVIVPFLQNTNNQNRNMYNHPDRVLSTVYLGNFLANGSTSSSNHVKNSIVGYSFGSIAAFTLAAEAPKGYFDTLVAVDLGSVAQKKNYNTDKLYLEEQLSEEEYRKISNMNFIFMSTKGNDHWHDQSMATTYNKLKGMGANAVFYTNLQDRIVDPNYNRGRYYVDDAIKVNSWNYNKHSQGYALINDTNILSYLSS